MFSFIVIVIFVVAVVVVVVMVVLMCDEYSASLIRSLFNERNFL